MVRVLAYDTLAPSNCEGVCQRSWLLIHELTIVRRVPNASTTSQANCVIELSSMNGKEWAVVSRKKEINELSLPYLPSGN